MTGLLILSKIQSIVQNQLGKAADEAARINAILGGVCPVALTRRPSVLLTGWRKFTQALNLFPLNYNFQVNLLGRACLPLISDRIGNRRPLYVISLASQAVLLGCLPTALANQSYTGVLICYFTICFFCKSTKNPLFVS